MKRAWYPVFPQTPRMGSRESIQPTNTCPFYWATITINNRCDSIIAVGTWRDIMAWTVGRSRKAIIPIALLFAVMVLFSPRVMGQDSPEDDNGEYDLAVVLIICCGLPTIGIITGIWAYKDADARGENGSAWLLICIFLPILGVLIWYVVRPRKTTGYPANHNPSMGPGSPSWPHHPYTHSSQYPPPPSAHSPIQQSSIYPPPPTSSSDSSSSQSGMYPPPPEKPPNQPPNY